MAYPDDYTPIRQFYGYVRLPHSSYDEWRSATLGYGFDADGFYGNQCWDYVAELYYQYGLTLVTKVGGGSAKDCWIISKNANAKYPFIAVEGVTNIKRGDVIITNANPYSTTGHICIADEDYNPDVNNKIWCLGQNQGHGTKAPVTRDKVSLNYFLGIFRNTEWQNVPPTPPTPPTPTPSETVYNRDRFKWELFKKKGKRKWIKNLSKRK